MGDCHLRRFGSLGARNVLSKLSRYEVAAFQPSPLRLPRKLNERLFADHCW